MKNRTRKRLQWSKLLTLMVIVAGVVIVQACFLLMYLCIRLGFSGTAAWLPAAVGLAEAVIGAGLQGYLSLGKAEHSDGGITMEAAKAAGFQESPGI